MLLDSRQYGPRFSKVDQLSMLIEALANHMGKYGEQKCPDRHQSLAPVCDKKI